jgi:hypothetical protein
MTSIDSAVAGGPVSPSARSSRCRPPHGGWRGAAALPLTDGAPDFGALFGVFFSY